MNAGHFWKIIIFNSNSETEVIIWDSGNPIVEEYIRGCSLLNRWRSRIDEYWGMSRPYDGYFICNDYIHPGYVALSQLTQILLNCLCNHLILLWLNYRYLICLCIFVYPFSYCPDCDLNSNGQQVGGLRGLFYTLTHRWKHYYWWWEPAVKHVITHWHHTQLQVKKTNKHKELKVPYVKEKQKQKQIYEFRPN